MRTSFATSFALSAAALLLAGCDKSKPEVAPAMELPSAPAGQVNCFGINQCKGQSACHTKSHACAGQNECKGKGWITAAKDECEKKGGKIL